MLIKLKNRSGYFKSSLIYFFSSLFSAVLGILINPLMAKNLSPLDYGILGYYGSFQSLIIPLLSFNLLSYYQRNIFSIPKEKCQIFVNTIFIGLFLIGFLFLVIFLTGFYYYCAFIKVEFHFFPYALYSICQLYISIFISYYQIKLRCDREVGKFAWLTILFSLISTGLTLLYVVFFKMGAEGKLLSALIASCLFSIYSVFKLVGKFQFDIKLLKDALNFGFPLTLSALFWYFFTGIDRSLLISLNDAYTYGVYNVAIQISGYMAIFYNSVNNAVEADIYQAIIQKNNKRIFMLMLTVMGVVIVANISFIALAPNVIGILTADRYLESTPFVQILAVQNITLALFYLIVKLFIGFGYVKSELFVRVIGAFISVIMYKYLINNYGFYGAAWGQVFSFLLLSFFGVLILIVFKKIIKI